jgi:hypothetical protein
MSIDFNQLGVDFRDWWDDASFYGPAPFFGFPPPTYRDNTKRGEALPYYLDENALKLLRDRSRALCSSNEFAICGVDNLRNFTVGTGFKYSARLADSDDRDMTYKKDPLVKDVQKFIDLFSEANDLPEREAESSQRADVDGEAFIRLFKRDDGMTLLRFVEPELIRSLGGVTDPKFSFGIETEPNDVETILNYWVIEAPMQSYTPVSVPESEIVHIKLNSRSTAKRGVPTFYPIEQNLRRAEGLLTNMSMMAKTRAGIAMIRYFEGTQKSAAQTFVDGQKEMTATDPFTNVQLSFERVRPGTILNAGKSIKYEFPHSNSGAAEFILVLQAELRACAARLNMPEWMFSADASNSNYSSSFVAESSATKMFGQRQDLLRRKWGQGRYGVKKSIIWRAIENAIEAGILPAEVKEKIKIVVEAPSLNSRDGDREASMNKVYADMKVKSRRTIQHEIGLDGEEEDKMIRADDLAPPPTADQPIQGEKPIQPGQVQTRQAVARNYSKVSESLPDTLDDSFSPDDPDVAIGADEMDRQELAALREQIAKLEGMLTVRVMSESQASHDSGTHIHLPENVGASIASGVAEGLKGMPPAQHIHNHEHKEVINIPAIEIPPAAPVNFTAGDVIVPPIVIPQAPSVVVPPAQVKVMPAEPAPERKPRKVRIVRDKKTGRPEGLEEVE